MMKLIFYIAPLVFIIWYFYLSSSYRRKLNLAKKFPGPRPIPLLGNFLEFIFRSSEDAFQLAIDYHKLLGGIYVVRVFNSFAFIVKDPKIMEQVLSNSSKYLDKGRLYILLSPWLGDGLILSKGKKWFSRRKIITPAFHFNILKQFVEVFDRQSSILVEILSEHSNGQVLNIEPFITRMALDVVCETAMGVRIKAQTDRNHQYVQSVGTISQIISERFTKIWMRSDLLFRYFANSKYKVYKMALDQLHNLTISIIRQRREAMKNEKREIPSTKQSEEAADLGIRDKMVLLDVLLQSTVDGKPLNDESIREEVDTFMFAGHDTTAACISFTLYLISRHKPVQDRLFDEVVDVIGNDRTTPITFKHLSNLKYMEAVIKESLRMYPPVPFFGRRLDDDIVLDDGRVIPKDTVFNMMLFVMFRDNQYFSNPDEFNPERFTTIDDSGTNPYAYIPFSAGPRNCIGQKFALLEIKSTISNILRHYELNTIGDSPKAVIELVLRSKNGIQLGLTSRPREKR